MLVAPSLYLIHEDTELERDPKHVPPRTRPPKKLSKVNLGTTQKVNPDIATTSPSDKERALIDS